MGCTMSDSAVHTFVMGGPYRERLSNAFYLSLIIAVFCVVMLLYPGVVEGFEGLPWQVWAGLGAWSALVCPLAFWASRRVDRHAVCVDEDGLWQALAPREDSLVRWDEIVVIRRRSFLKRMDLEDERGVVRLRIGLHLRDLGYLEELLAERAVRLRHWNQALVTEPIPTRYRSRPMRYFGYTIRTLVYPLLITVSAVVHPVLIVPLGLWLFVRTVRDKQTVRRVELEDGALVLRFPFRSIRFPVRAIDDIVELEARDGLGPYLPYPFSSMSRRVPAAAVFVQGEKRPYLLHDMGVNAEDLVRRLRIWLSENAGER